MGISLTAPVRPVSRIPLPSLDARIVEVGTHEVAGNGAQTPFSGSQHPRRNSTCAEIIRHVAAVHHRFLGECLEKLDGLFDQLDVLNGGNQDGFRQVRELFIGFQLEVRQCIVYEKRFVFPEIERWASNFPFSPPSQSLLCGTRDLAQWHAKAWMQLWRLARRVGDLRQKEVNSPLLTKLQAVLSALCNDFEQQLFEEDCLLLPRIKGWHATSLQRERQLCPPS